MPLYTKAEFSKICGMGTNQLSVNIQRKDIVVVTDKDGLQLIDADEPINRAFVIRRSKYRRSAEDRAVKLVQGMARRYGMSAADVKKLVQGIAESNIEAVEDMEAYKNKLKTKYGWPV